jgi:hypothetical protein
VLAFMLAGSAQDPRDAAAEEPSGTIVTVAGGGTSAPRARGSDELAVEVLLTPQDVATDSEGNVYVAEWACFVSKVINDRLTVAASSDGGCLNGFANNDLPPNNRLLSSPHAVAMDAAGDLYIGSGCFVVELADDAITRIAGFINTGNVCAGGGVGEGGPATEGGLNDASGVAVDVGGNVYIADAGACRVHRVGAADGIITTVAGSGVCGYGGDGGPATAARLNAPWGIELDGDGNLYIADSQNCRVRKVDGGTITTIAGTGTCGFSRDIGDGGPATEALLIRPAGVAIDADGALYVSELGACRVRKVARGTMSTFAGTGICGYSGDGGPATDAMLNAPIGVAVDDAGNLYIADSRNGRVRMVVGVVAATGATGHRPNMTRSVPSPLEVSTDPGVIGTNISLALLTLFVILLASQLFNATLSENRAQIEGWFAPLRNKIRAISVRLPAMPVVETPRLVSLVKWPALILGMTVLIYGFAEPGFGLNTRSAILALSLTITVGLITYGVEGGKAYFARRRYARRTGVRPFPLAIAVAIINVVFCRAIGFAPGIIFGFVGIFTLLETAPRPLTREEAGKTVLWPLVGLFSFCIVAWFLVVPTRALARDTGYAVAAFFESTSVSLFVVGIQGIVLGLIPLTFMDGDKIWRWSKLAWGTVGLFAIALGWHTLVNKDQAYLEILSSTVSLTAFVILMMVSVLSVAFWYYFARDSLGVSWRQMIQNLRHMRRFKGSWFSSESRD